MDKIDLRKDLKHLYLPSARQISVVEVPRFQFAMVDGEIEPGASPGLSPAFQQALEALYGISYTLKFMSKQCKENPLDYTVMALEALWWIEGGEFDITKPDNWRWTAMILQPDHITLEMYAEALTQLRKKRPGPALDRLRLEAFHEGLCMQIMHIGPYADEPRTLEGMRQFASQNGYTARGKHHEIYLGDPRRPRQAQNGAEATCRKSLSEGLTQPPWWEALANQGDIYIKETGPMQQRGLKWLPGLFFNNDRELATAWQPGQ